MIYKRRVQFYETDAQGIVHHSNYFRYFEEARGEFLREKGLPYSKMREEGYEVVLISACCEFKKPVYYDEIVEIHLKVENLNRFTFEFSYDVKVNDELRARGRTKHCVVKNGKLVSIPEKYMNVLRAGLEPARS